MKKYTGQIIFNLIVAAVGGLLFSSAIVDVSGSVPLSLLSIVLLMGSLTVGNFLFVKQADSEKKAFQRSYIITDRTFENLIEPKDYLEAIKDLKDYPPCRNEAQKLLDQWELFRKKSDTLDTISSRGGVYDLVNQDVESVMLRNMVLFMKRAAIMQSASKNEGLSEHKSYLKSITDYNDKIINDYTSLLIEASQLTGEDSGKAEVESLQILIDSIRDYRKKLEKGDLS